MQKVIEKARMAYVPTAAPVIPQVVPQVVPQIVPPAPTIGSLPVPTAASSVQKPVDAATLQSLYSLYAAANMNLNPAAAQSLLGLTGTTTNEAFLKYFYSQAGVLPTGVVPTNPAITVANAIVPTPAAAIPIIDITKKSSSDVSMKKESGVPSKTSYKRSKSRSISKSPRSRSRSYSRSRSRSSDREDRYSRRRRDRSDSRERRRSRDRYDRYDKRDKSRRDSRERERGRYRRSSSHERSRSYNNSRDDRPYNAPLATRNTENNTSNTTNNGNGRNPANGDVWEVKPAQQQQQFLSTDRDKLMEIKNKRNPNAFQNSYPPNQQQKNQNQQQQEEPPQNDDYGHCVRINNVERECFYSDIRRFFFGLAIGQNDIKIMYDQEYGSRTGEVLVRFLSAESKKIALEKNLTILKNNVVTITSITDDDFQKSVDKPNKYVGGNRNVGTNYISSEDAKKVQNPDDFWDDDGDKIDLEAKSYATKYNYLMVDDLPRFCRIDDVRRSFPSAVEIAFPKNAVFLRYRTPLEAKKIMDDRYAHYINNKRVYLSISDEKEFTKEKSACRPEFIWCADKKKDDDIVIVVDDDMDGSHDNGNSFNRNSGNPNNRAANFNAFKNNWNSVIDSNSNSKVGWRPLDPRTNWNSNSNKSDGKSRWGSNSDSKSDYNNAGSDAKTSYNTSSKSNSNWNDEDWNNDSRNSNGKSDTDRSPDRNATKDDPSKTIPGKAPPSLMDLKLKVNNVTPSDLVEILEEDVSESDCVIIKNLSQQTTEVDVVAFLRKVDVNPQRVHILWDKQGKPSGDCFCEFNSKEVAKKALQLDNFSLDENIVSIKLIAREKVEAILSSFSDSAKKQPQMKSNGSSLNGSMPDEPDDRVVYLSNVPYYCSHDDILEQYREYELNPEQIVRRFVNGRPSGNVVITFNTPEDAASARRKKVRINGRFIIMKTVG